MEGPVNFEDPGPKSIGGRVRSLSPESKASYGAATDKETLQAPLDNENSSRLIAYYSAPQSIHYGISSISPESAAVAATAATAAAAGYSYSLPPYASLEQHEPRIGGVDRKRAESPISPQQMNTQPSTSAEHASSPEPLYDASYVNAKQFYRILKRREARQRLEEALRFTSKGRKPYLHGSRRDHAMLKDRRPGGRLLFADEVTEIEQNNVENKKEIQETPAAKVYGRSDLRPFKPESQSRKTQHPISSTPDPENAMIDSNLQAQRGSSHATISFDPGQVAIGNSRATEIGDALSDASQSHARGRNLTRSKSLSQTRNAGSNESIVAMKATPRSRSAGMEEGTSFIRSRTRSNLGTDEEDSWSSEFEEDAIPKPPTLTGDQRKRVEQVMETFWDVMNKNWKYHIYEKTRNPGEAGASSIANESTSRTTSRNSTLPVPSQKSLGKRPASDDERDNEERQPKRNRDNSNLPADTSEKIKYSCPYRKHNRQRYNVHTHRTCALTGFPDIARIKEHLYRNHRAPIQCHRCTLLFYDRRALKTHIKAKTMCELVQGVPVEGFELDVEEQLRRRKKSSRDQPVESRWAEIYLLLFPDDDPNNIPSPFWEPPIDEPALTSISIEDYIRQEVPRRVRQLIEDRLAAGEYSYELALILSNQMMEIFDAQIDSCILEHRSIMGKGSQESDPPTPPPSSRSPVASVEHRLAVSLSSSTSAPQSTSLVSEDWFATYLQSETSSEIPMDPFLSFLPPFSRMPLDKLSGADNMQEDFSTELCYTQNSQQIDGEA